MFPYCLSQRAVFYGTFLSALLTKSISSPIVLSYKLMSIKKRKNSPYHSSFFRKRWITHRLSIPANSCDNHSNPSELRHWTSLIQSEVLLVQYTHSTQQRSWTRFKDIPNVLTRNGWNWFKNAAQVVLLIRPGVSGITFSAAVFIIISEYYGYFYTTCPDWGNHCSGLMETALPVIREPLL